jgi:hypothetical protein
MVKRITGVPGGLVEGQRGRIFVAANCYFVMGDNHANSFDTRQWGVLSRAQIIGRARLILWSSGAGRTDSRERHAAVLGADPRRLGAHRAAIQSDSIVVCNGSGILSEPIPRRIRPSSSPSRRSATESSAVMAPSITCRCAI